MPKVGEFTVDRDSANDLILYDLAVSRRHASISHGAAGYFLDDLQSDNGTFIEREDNLIVVKEPTLLRHALAPQCIRRFGQVHQAASDRLSMSSGTRPPLD